MRSTNRLIGVVAGSVVAIVASGVWAQDWPQWRGPNRDGKVANFTAPQSWPAALTQKWRTSVGSGDATPALVGGRLYVFARQGDDEVVLCLDAEDGKELWREKYAAQAVTGAAASHPGPRSSPAVAEGKVVTLGVGGVLSCLDAARGQLVWRKDPFPRVVPMFFTAASPLIVDGMAVAHLGGQGRGAIIAYDLTTGDEKWRWDGEGPEYASPVLLTAGTTILGLIPMATGVSYDFHTMHWATRSESSQWWASMAIAVIFGLAFATLLTLVVVPTLYVTLMRARRWLGLGSEGPGSAADEVAAG